MPEFNPDSSDLKGLLVKQVDENGFMKGNYFHEKLANCSQVFNEIIGEKQDKKSSFRTLTKNRVSNMTQYSEENLTETTNFAPSASRKTPNDDMMTFKTSVPLDKYERANKTDRYKVRLSQIC